MQLVVGLCQQQEKKDAILQTLKSNGFYRSAIIERSANGNLIIRQNSIPKPSQILICGFIASLIFTLLLTAGIPLSFAALIGSACFGISWLALSRLLLGIDRSLIKKYSHWLLPNEIFIAIQTNEQRLDETISSLRKIGCEEKLIFAFQLPHIIDQAYDQSSKSKSKSLIETLNKYERIFTYIQKRLKASLIAGHETSGPDWMLDRFFLIHTQITNIRHHYAKQIRSPLAPLTIDLRVYDTALKLLSQTSAPLNKPAVIDFLNTYQITYPLTNKELCNLPWMLRLALIEKLLEHAIQTNRQHEDAQLAIIFFRQLLKITPNDPESILATLKKLHIEPSAFSSSFAVKLKELLSEEKSISYQITEWVEKIFTFPESLPSPNQTPSNLLDNLNYLSKLNWDEILEKVSDIEKILSEDPVNAYTQSDLVTRALYKQAIEDISYHTQIPETEIAKYAMKMATESASGTAANHVGYYLIDDGRIDLENHFKSEIPINVKILRRIKLQPQIYIWGIISLTVLILTIALALAVYYGGRNILGLILVSLVALIPASQLAVQFATYLINQIYPSNVLPKMQFKANVPESFRTLVVTSFSLSNRKLIAGQIENLEIQYLSNQDPNIYFAVLCAADNNSGAEADENSPIVLVKKQIEALNSRYENKFFLFHAPSSETKEIAWEHFNQYLMNPSISTANKPNDNIVKIGDQSDLVRIKFIIKLNSDTQLSRHSAKQMIETLAHPLNRTEIDTNGNVKHGYVIIQPDIISSIPSTTENIFTKLFSSVQTRRPNFQTISKTAQIVFGTSNPQDQFIYEPAALQKTLKSQIKTVYAADIELSENFPASYQAYCETIYSDTRNNWRIVCEMISREKQDNSEPNKPKIIRFWKKFDQLQSSLLPISFIGLLIISWLLPSVKPSVWATLVGLIIFTPSLSHATVWLTRSPRNNKWAWHQQIRRIGYSLMTISVLPHQVWIIADAIIYGRKNRDASLFIDDSIKQIPWLSLSAFLLICILILTNFIWWEIAIPFILLWILCPIFLWALHEYRLDPETKTLKETDKLFLRQIARQTWDYFDHLVKDKTQPVPPSYLQEDSYSIAQYITPSNIGYWLCSLSSAHDFSYASPQQFIEKASATFTRLNKLPRHEGHFFNKYDVETLTPIEKNYLSASDGGHLIAGLWVFSETCEDIINGPIISVKALHSLADTIVLLKNALNGKSKNIDGPLITLTVIFNDAPNDLDKIIQRIKLAARPTKQLIDLLRSAHQDDNIGLYWAERFQAQLDAWTSYVNIYLSWINSLSNLERNIGELDNPSMLTLRDRLLSNGISLKMLAQKEILLISQLSAIKTETKWITRIIDQFNEASIAAQNITHQLKELMSTAKKIQGSMNMSLFYDSSQHLLAEGYSILANKQNNEHHHFLMNETRLTSLIAIARGDIQSTHWQALLKPYSSVNKRHILLSENGSLTEYLMPLLFMRNYEHSIIDDACHEALMYQIHYAETKNIPWGISQTASISEESKHVHIKAGGVPGLGINQIANTSLSVSPYSTILALAVFPGLVVENLQRLINLNTYGSKGFYEAINFNVTSEDSQHRKVANFYITDHQSMILLAINNALNDSPIQKRFHRHLGVRINEALLFMRNPLTLFSPAIREKFIRHLNVLTQLLPISR